MAGITSVLCDMLLLGLLGSALAASRARAELDFVSGHGYEYIKFGIFDLMKTPPGGWELLSEKDLVDHKAALVANYNVNGGFQLIGEFQSVNCCVAIKGGKKLGISGTTYTHQFLGGAVDDEIKCNPDGGYKEPKYRFYKLPAMSADAVFAAKEACATDHNPAIYKLMTRVEPPRPVPTTTTTTTAATAAPAGGPEACEKRYVELNNKKAACYFNALGKCVMSKEQVECPPLAPVWVDARCVVFDSREQLPKGTWCDKYSWSRQRCMKLYVELNNKKAACYFNTMGKCVMSKEHVKCVKIPKTTSKCVSFHAKTPLAKGKWCFSHGASKAECEKRYVVAAGGWQACVFHSAGRCGMSKEAMKCAEASQCLPNWEGPKCDTKVACGADHCNGHGAIKGNKADGCSCACHFAWVGARCARMRYAWPTQYPTPSAADCKAGRYKASDMRDCADCAAGTYADQTGQTACKMCAKGTYSEQAAQASKQACKMCAKGKYNIDEGKGSVWACFDCAMGKYGDQAGQTAPAACVSCTAGMYSDVMGAPSKQACKMCAKGTYSEQAAQASKQACKMCAKGKYNNDEGKGSARACSHCTMGKYGDQAGQTAPAACKLCGKGTYNDEAGQDAATDCKSCAAGMYSDLMGAPSKQACKMCTQGHFQNETGRSACKAKSTCPVGQGESVNGGATADRECVACATVGAGHSPRAPGGSYSGADDGQPCVALTTCKGDEYESRAPSVSFDRDCSTHRASCPSGQYTFHPPNSTHDRVCHDVLPCIAGRYQTENATQFSNRQCEDCQPGRYQDGENAASCVECASGKHRAASVPASSAERAACMKCGTGRFQSRPGQLLCEACAAGKFRNASVAASAPESAACSVCQRGRYQDAAGQLSCVACAAGKFRTNEPASSPEQFACVACTAGRYQEVTGALSCVRCAAGKFRDARVKASEAEPAACRACLAGQYQPAEGRASCVQCGTGTYRNASVAASETEAVACVVCAQGRFQPRVGQLLCEACAAGKFRTNVTASSAEAQAWNSGAVSKKVFDGDFDIQLECRQGEATFFGFRGANEPFSPFPECLAGIDVCKAKCEEFDWCQSAEFSTVNRYCVLGVQVGVGMPSVGGWMARPVDERWWVDKEVTAASGNTRQAANCWKKTTGQAPAPTPPPVSWKNLGAGGCKCNDCAAKGTNVRRLQKQGLSGIDACKAKCEEFDWCQSAEFSTGNHWCVLGVQVGVGMPSVGGWTAYPVDGLWWVDKEVTAASGDTRQAANCWKKTTGQAPAPTPPPVSWKNLGAGGCMCNDCAAKGTNVRSVQKQGLSGIDACKAKCEEFDWCQSAEFSTGNRYCVLGVEAGASMPSEPGWTAYAADGKDWVDEEVTRSSGITAQAAHCWKYAEVEASTTSGCIKCEQHYLPSKTKIQSQLGCEPRPIQHCRPHQQGDSCSVCKGGYKQQGLDFTPGRTSDYICVPKWIEFCKRQESVKDENHESSQEFAKAKKQDPNNMEHWVEPMHWGQDCVQQNLGPADEAETDCAKCGWAKTSAASEYPVEWQTLRYTVQLWSTGRATLDVAPVCEIPDWCQYSPNYAVTKPIISLAHGAVRGVQFQLPAAGAAMIGLVCDDTYELSTKRWLWADINGKPALTERYDDNGPLHGTPKPVAYLGDATCYYNIYRSPKGVLFIKEPGWPQTNTELPLSGTKPDWQNDVWQLRVDMHGHVQYVRNREVFHVSQSKIRLPARMQVNLFAHRINLDHMGVPDAIDNKDPAPIEGKIIDPRLVVDDPHALRSSAASWKPWGTWTACDRRTSTEKRTRECNVPATSAPYPANCNGLDGGAKEQERKCRLCPFNFQERTYPVFERLEDGSGWDYSKPPRCTHKCGADERAVPRVAGPPQCAELSGLWIVYPPPKDQKPEPRFDHPRDKPELVQVDGSYRLALMQSVHESGPWVGRVECGQKSWPGVTAPGMATWDINQKYKDLANEHHKAEATFRYSVTKEHITILGTAPLTGDISESGRRIVWENGYVFVKDVNAAPLRLDSGLLFGTWAAVPDYNHTITPYGPCEGCRVLAIKNEGRTATVEELCMRRAMHVTASDVAAGKEYYSVAQIRAGAPLRDGQELAAKTVSYEPLATTVDIEYDQSKDWVSHWVKRHGTVPDFQVGDQLTFGRNNGKCLSAQARAVQEAGFKCVPCERGRYQPDPGNVGHTRTSCLSQPKCLEGSTIRQYPPSTDTVLAWFRQDDKPAFTGISAALNWEAHISLDDNTAISTDGGRAYDTGFRAGDLQANIAVTWGGYAVGALVTFQSTGDWQTGARAIIGGARNTYFVGKKANSACLEVRDGRTIDGDMEACPKAQDAAKDQVWSLFTTGTPHTVIFTKDRDGHGYLYVNGDLVGHKRWGWALGHGGEGLDAQDLDQRVVIGGERGGRNPWMAGSDTASDASSINEVIFYQKPLVVQGSHAGVAQLHAALARHVGVSSSEFVRVGCFKAKDAAIPFKGSVDTFSRDWKKLQKFARQKDAAEAAKQQQKHFIGASRVGQGVEDTVFYLLESTHTVVKDAVRGALEDAPGATPIASALEQLPSFNGAGTCEKDGMAVRSDEPNMKQRHNNTGSFKDGVYFENFYAVFATLPPQYTCKKFNELCAHGTPAEWPLEDDHCGKCNADTSPPYTAYYLEQRRCHPLGKCGNGVFYIGVFADNLPANTGPRNWATAADVFTCTPCQPGRWYKAAANSHRTSRCHDCPAGKYQGHSGKDACNACEVGRSQPKDGQAACIDCVLGKYETHEEQTACKHCAAGKYHDDGVGKTAESACKDCPKGRYLDETAQDEQSDCKKCAAGQFADQAGLPMCKKCALGKHQPDETAATACANCEAGRFAAKLGQPACKMCGKGRYSSEAGTGGCALCPAGKVSSWRLQHLGKVTACDISCRAGQTFVEATGCVACPAGQYSDKVIVGDNDAKSVQCKKCTAGMFQNRKGQAYCKQTRAARGLLGSCTMPAGIVPRDHATATGLKQDTRCDWLAGVQAKIDATTGGYCGLTKAEEVQRYMQFPKELQFVTAGLGVGRPSIDMLTGVEARKQCGTSFDSLAGGDQFLVGKMEKDTQPSTACSDAAMEGLAAVAKSDAFKALSEMPGIGDFLKKMETLGCMLVAFAKAADARANALRAAEDNCVSDAEDNCVSDAAALQAAEDNCVSGAINGVADCFLSDSCVVPVYGCFDNT
eukprot:g2047.t1